MEERLSKLREERLELEREALELEKARFAAERERSGRIAPHRAVSVVPLVAALSFAAFAAGVATGLFVASQRARDAREAKLRAALSGLSAEGIEAEILNSATNAPGGAGRIGAHRNVSVIVIE